MNRFEQDKPYLSGKFICVLPIGAFLLLLFLFLQGINAINNLTTTKQKDNLEKALTRSITQCYVVEGVYPPSVEYLVEHYGLFYNEETFLINYEYIGSDMMPEVRVHLQQTGEND